MGGKNYKLFRYKLDSKQDKTASHFNNNIRIIICLFLIFRLKRVNRHTCPQKKFKSRYLFFRVEQMYYRGIFPSFINKERLFHLDAKPSKYPLIEVKLSENFNSCFS